MRYEIDTDKVPWPYGDEFPGFEDLEYEGQEISDEEGWPTLHVSEWKGSVFETTFGLAKISGTVTSTQPDVLTTDYTLHRRTSQLQAIQALCAMADLAKAAGFAHLVPDSEERSEDAEGVVWGYCQFSRQPTTTTNINTTDLRPAAGVLSAT